MIRKKRYYSDFLFPKSNFYVGMGSVLDISGRYFQYNYSKSENEADKKAIESDWGNTGEDILDAADQIKKQFISVDLELIDE